MEEEFIQNQERLKPQEERHQVHLSRARARLKFLLSPASQPSRICPSAQEERTKVDELRGTPMSVGTLEEIIDDTHAIVSSAVGPEYYVRPPLSLVQHEFYRAVDRVVTIDSTGAPFPIPDSMLVLPQVTMLSIVDKDELELGCSVLLHHKVHPLLLAMLYARVRVVSVFNLPRTDTQALQALGLRTSNGCPQEGGRALVAWHTERRIKTFDISKKNSNPSRDILLFIYKLLHGPAYLVHPIRSHSHTYIF